jgi:hypothetical protein
MAFGFCTFAAFKHGRIGPFYIVRFFVGTFLWFEEFVERLLWWSC